MPVFIPDKLTTQQACAISGLSSARVKQLIRTKRFEAIKLGRDWLIDAKSFRGFLEQPRTHGRPRKILR